MGQSGKKEFIAIQKNVFLVKGAAAAALYDYRERKVWPVPAFLCAVIEGCAQGMALGEAADRAAAAGGRLPLDVLLYLAREHPALELTGRRPRLPSPPPVNRSVGPELLVIEPTESCNLQCRHCYTSSGPEGKAAGLPAGRWLDLMREAREIGFRDLQITGGEPSLYGDLPVLLRAARSLGFERVSVFTNLLTLGAALVDLVCDLRIEIHTSIYSSQPPLHDAITGRAGSFDLTISKLRELLARGVDVHVSVTLMDTNSATREETVSFLRQLGLGADHIRVNPVRPQGRGADMECPPSLRYWPYRLRKWPDGPEASFTASTCWAGKATVAPNGDVYVCVGAREPLGNVAGGRLGPIIAGSEIRRLWAVTLDDVPVCAQCEYRYCCIDCRAMARMLTGDLYARDPRCPYDPLTGTWRCEIPRLDEKPKRAADVAIRDVAENAVLTRSRDRQMHIFNPVGAAIWDLCDGRQTAREIVDLLVAHFGAPEPAVRDDVLHLLGQLRSKGLIE
jgi:radical SAM protein with 4Fe4S-binding SPASM domain